MSSLLSSSAGFFNGASSTERRAAIFLRVRTKKHVRDGQVSITVRRAWADLVLLAEVLLLALALGGLGADLLEVLLEGREVLAGLGELALLHALTDVPVDEGALGVHEVELVVDAR